MNVFGFLTEEEKNLEDSSESFAEGLRRMTVTNILAIERDRVYNFR
jgi:hypothetical protein